MTRTLYLALLAAFCTGAIAQQDVQTVTIECAADTMLHELIPAANFGASIQVNAGSTQHPTPSGPTRTRGLFSFPVEGKIPRGARILAASVDMEVLFVPAPNESSYELHKMLVPWTEGGGAGNSGREALPGETSWTWRARPQNWAVPGGLAGTDFTAAASAAVSIGAAGTATWRGEGLAADIENWMNDPDSNFGWMLLCASEDVPQSAKRFGSREGGKPARLTVQYTLATPELRLSIEKAGSNVILTCTGGNPPFQLQTLTTLGSTNWMNIGSPLTNRTQNLLIATNAQFFRLATVP